MRIVENVEMLEIPSHSGFINLTLIWDDSNMVLVDAGFPGQIDAIVQAIENIGKRVEDITHVIITHQDMDHIGCTMDILNLSPTAKVISHTDEAPYIDGSKTPIKLAAMIAKYDDLSQEQKDWCDRIKEGYANLKLPISQTVTDGEILPICGGIKVIHTPGHTPGHICLLLQESGIIISGDAVNISDGQLIGPNPQHTYDMPLGAQSFEKIKVLNPKELISYHCGYWSS